MKQLLFTLVVCWFSATSMAQGIPPGLKTNGCGTNGFSSWLVPDGTIVSQCSFKSSCDKHDVCYSRCLEGGDLYKTPACDDASARKERRKMCDINFQNNIKEVNAGKPICGAYASLYRWAVEKFGESAFKGLAASSSEIKTLVKFVGYLEKNPSVFSSNQLERIDSAFELLASDTQGKYSDVRIDFVQGIPRMVIVFYSTAEQKYVTIVDERGSAP